MVDVSIGMLNVRTVSAAMVGFLVIALGQACSSKVDVDPMHDDTLVKGSPSGAARDFAVYIGNKCTGALVAPHVVLTAPHCFLKRSTVFRCESNPTGQRPPAQIDENQSACTARLGVNAYRARQETASVTASDSALVG